MKRPLLRLLLTVILAVLVMASPASCQLTVILSRHAEKAAAPPKDPPLSSAGEKRAALLAGLLTDVPVDAIYTSEYVRTQQTAAPLAAHNHLKPIVVPAADPAALVKAVRERQTGVVVIVGHSNTVPGIIATLGGPTVSIADSEYDNLFILTLDGSKSSLLRLRFGDKSAAGDRDHSMATSPVK